MACLDHSLKGSGCKLYVRFGDQGLWGLQISAYVGKGVRPLDLGLNPKPYTHNTAAKVQVMSKSRTLAETQMARSVNGSFLSTRVRCPPWRHKGSNILPVPCLLA